MFEKLPKNIRKMIAGNLQTTRDRLNLALSSKTMYETVKEMGYLADFNCSELISPNIRVLYGYCTIMRNVGMHIRKLTVDGNSTFLLMVQAYIPDIGAALPNVSEICIRRSGKVPFLHFLKDQGNLQKLTLEKVQTPAIEFRNALAAMGKQFVEVVHPSQLADKRNRYIVHSTAVPKSLAV